MSLAALLSAPDLPDDDSDEDADFAPGEAGDSEDDGGGDGDDDFAPGGQDDGQDEDGSKTDVGDEGEEDGGEDEGEDDGEEGGGGSLRYGTHPLHSAASRADHEALERFLKEGKGSGKISLSADRAIPFEVDGVDRNGQSPLVAALIDAGTAISLRAHGAHDAWAPKTAARVDLLKTATPANPMENPELLSSDMEELGRIGEEYLRCLSLLLDAKAAPGSPYFGRSPLHIAAALGALPPCATFAAEATRRLLGAGASVLAADHDGATPFHYAAQASFPVAAGERHISPMMSQNPYSLISLSPSLPPSLAPSLPPSLTRCIRWRHHPAHPPSAISSAPMGAPAMGSPPRGLEVCDDRW